MNDDAKLRQDLELLAGTRRQGDRSKAAVRLADLDGLLEIPSELKSVKVGAVTAADFNKLVDEVLTLHGKLMIVVKALRTRRGR